MPYSGVESPRGGTPACLQEAGYPSSSSDQKEATGPRQPCSWSRLMQDAPFSRAYRNSIKDAQSRVLGATSFLR